MKNKNTNEKSILKNLKARRNEMFIREVALYVSNVNMTKRV